MRVVDAAHPASTVQHSKLGTSVSPGPKKWSQLNRASAPSASASRAAASNEGQSVPYCGIWRPMRIGADGIWATFLSAASSRFWSLLSVEVIVPLAALCSSPGPAERHAGASASGCPMQPYRRDSRSTARPKPVTAPVAERFHGTRRASVAVAIARRRLAEGSKRSRRAAWGARCLGATRGRQRRHSGWAEDCESERSWRSRRAVIDSGG
jgi:hypothetical protein